MTEELDAEFAAHLAFAADELIAQGLPPDEARRQARLAFGSAAAVRTDAVAQRPMSWVYDLGRDLRLSLRQVRRAPIAALALMLTAALGIGGLSLVFSVVNAAWLRPLPYAQAEALESVLAITPTRTVQRAVSAEVASAIREAVQGVGRVAEYDAGSARVVTPASSRLLPVTQVDSALFSVLRVRTSAGRLPTAEEYATAADVALVRDAVWRTLPAAERRAERAQVVIDGRPHVVIGAFRDAMHFPERSEVWVPMRADVTHRGVVVRRDADVSRDELAAALNAAHADARLDGWRLLPAQIVDRGESLPVAVAFAVLFVLAGLLAVATAANVALQNVAMAVRRRAELATWAALGATSSRLVRRLLADQVLIVGAAGIVGTALAQAGLQLVRREIVTEAWPGWISLSLDWRTIVASLVFTTTMMALTAVLPAREGRRVDPVRAMREGGMSGISALGARRSTTRLMALQLALSLALSGVAAVLVVAYREANLAARHPGDAQRLEASIFGSSANPRSARDDAQALDSLAAVVAAAGVGRAARFTDVTGRRFEVPARARLRAVDFAYLSVDGRRVIAGRSFERSAAGREPEALVNEGFARALGVPRDSVLGREIVASDGVLRHRIVGVVADRGRDAQVARALRVTSAVEVLLARHEGLDGREQLLVFADSSVARVRTVLRAAGTRLAPDGDLGRLTTLAETQRLQLFPIALAYRVIGVAAAIVLLISMVGLHGLVSQMAASRRLEVGIRVALGATPRRVAAQVAAQSLRGAIAGMLTGAALATAVAGMLVVMLELPMLAVALGLIAISAAVVAAVLVACAGPLLRLLRDEPASLLRAP